MMMSTEKQHFINLYKGQCFVAGGGKTEYEGEFSEFIQSIRYLINQVIILFYVLV